MPTTSSRERSARLEARTTRSQKALFKHAADLQGRTLSDFIVQAASDAATRVVEQHQIITLAAGGAGSPTAVPPARESLLAPAGP